MNDEEYEKLCERALENQDSIDMMRALAGSGRYGDQNEANKIADEVIELMNLENPHGEVQ